MPHTVETALIERSNSMKPTLLVVYIGNDMRHTLVRTSDTLLLFDCESVSHEARTRTLSCVC